MTQVEKLSFVFILTPHSIGRNANVCVPWHCLPWVWMCLPSSSVCSHAFLWGEGAVDVTAPFWGFLSFFQCFVTAHTFLCLSAFTFQCGRRFFAGLLPRLGCIVCVIQTSSCFIVYQIVKLFKGFQDDFVFPPWVLRRLVNADPLFCCFNVLMSVFETVLLC